MHDLDLARRWLIRDGQAFRSFTPLPSPGYGRFEWNDYTGDSPVKFEVTWFYDADNTSLMRREERDGVVKSTLRVARNVLTEGNVKFEVRDGIVNVEIISTAGKISRSANIIVAQRRR